MSLPLDTSRCYYHTSYSGRAIHTLDGPDVLRWSSYTADVEMARAALRGIRVGQ